MLKKIIPFILLGWFVAVSNTYGQDPQFSQYYAAPLYLNPGFVGVTPQQRMVVNHRVQWPNLPQAFSTYSFSYEMFVNELKSGFGILATTDKMGSAGWRTTYVGLLYSYKVRVNKNWVFSPGLYFGYGNNGIDRSKLQLRDGLEFDGSSLDPELNKLGNTSFFDFSAGAVLYNKSLWFGFSSYHLNRPNLSILGQESRLPIRINVHGGMKLPLYNGPRTLSKVSYLTPSFVYRMQGASFQQLDVGLQYHIDPVAVGVWYRGIPIKDTFKDESDIIQVVQKDAVVFVMSLLFGNFQVGYSYDFTISRLQTSTGGSHEVSLIYEFVAKGFRKGVKRKDKLIPCPSFNSKEGFWN